LPSFDWLETFMLRSCAVLGFILVGAASASAAAFEIPTDKPAHEDNYKQLPNIVPIINDEHRVRHVWCNGRENVYFKGNTDALNSALKNLAAVKADRRTVVLRPGPGKTRFYRDEQLHLVSWEVQLFCNRGVANRQSYVDMHVYVGGPIKLEELVVPDGIELLEIADLQMRSSKLLDGRDPGVRIRGCHEIAELDPYSVAAMHSVAKMLNDADDRVKSGAVSALAQFKDMPIDVANELVEKLQSVRSDDARLQKQIAALVESLRKEASAAARARQREAIGDIRSFVAARREKRSAPR
jgi:hypothetical protein